MKLILLRLFLLFTLNSFSQTKTECLEFIRKKEISQHGNNFLSLNLEGTILKIKTKRKLNDQPTIVETEIDFSRAKKVIIEFNKFKLYCPIVFLTGKNYSLKETPENGFWYMDYKDRYEYNYYVDENEAVEVKNIFIQLAKLCGSKLEN